MVTINNHPPILVQIYSFNSLNQCSGFTSSESEETLACALKRIIYQDSTEPVATHPLAINISDEELYFPAVDLTKNVCELIDVYGDIAATYDYAPFSAEATGTSSDSAVPANPLQWSSEVYDSELDLVYYNYRHYSPTLGRFLSRDPIEEQGGLNLYACVKNNGINSFDWIGRLEPCSSYKKTRWCGGLKWEGRTRQNSGRSPSLNGCGPESGLLGTGIDIIPDSYFNSVFFKSACDYHDACYGQICHPDLARKEGCDFYLKIGMEDLCMTAYRDGKITQIDLLICMKQASAYYLAVLTFGKGAFEDAQDQACSWEECRFCLFE